MSAKSRKEVLEQARQRYGKRGREGRSRLLDEACELCGYERKYAIKVLSGNERLWASGARKRGGSQAIYGEPEREVIKTIWLAAEQPCGKRLKAALEVWLPHYEKRRRRLAESVRQKVLAISASSIDRLLAPCRASQGARARCGTRPGTLLRKQIPVRTEHWDVSTPGFIEADTVAHCGESMAGEFCWSLTATDVHTLWTETLAVFTRGQHAVAKRIAEIEAALPFAILGFDTDNGGEFLNRHLLNYFARRRRPVGFTRSRAYRKNDNARVEQKNWTHVRQLVGYARGGSASRRVAQRALRQGMGVVSQLLLPVMRHCVPKWMAAASGAFTMRHALPAAQSLPVAGKEQIAALENLSYWSWFAGTCALVEGAKLAPLGQASAGLDTFPA